MSTSFPFVPVRRQAATPFASGDPLADQIIAAIAVGALGVGDRLPPEAEMSGTFGVAIATLRKSLGVLREQGVVETRRGREGGTFVLAIPFPTVGQVRDYLATLHVVDLRDFADEHATIAAGIAGLACERATDRTLHELRVRAAGAHESARWSPKNPTTGEAAAGRAEPRAPAVIGAERRPPGLGDATPTDLAWLATVDNRFYVALGSAAQSPRLLRSYTRLCSELSPLKWSPVAAGTTAAQARDERQRIVEAISARRPEGARSTVASCIRETVYRVIDAKLALENSPDRCDPQREDNDGRHE